MEVAAAETATAETATAPCWSAVVRNRATEPQEPVPSRVFGSFNSSKGIAVAVVDANAIIHGDKLAGSADKFVSVAEVLEEVRDPVSRQRLSFLPFPIETMDPSPEFIKKGENYELVIRDYSGLAFCKV